MANVYFNGYMLAYHVLKSHAKLRILRIESQTTVRNRRQKYGMES